jgi:hypothetical protein
MSTHEEETSTGQGKLTWWGYLLELWERWFPTTENK